MASPSKEENILKLILGNSPLKEWHFEEIVNQSKVTRAVANKWLKKYVQEGLLKKVETKGRFPYFTVGEDNIIYYSHKRIYALDQLYASGIVSQLMSLNVEAVIFFGSVIKGDWYMSSDIDIFILGEVSGFNKAKYELKLQRHIELHVFQDREELKKIKTGLIKNIMNGYIVKGQIQDIAKVII